MCPVVKNKAEVLVEIRKLDEEAETRKKMAKPKNVPLPPSSSKSSVSVGGIEDVGLFRLNEYEPRKRKVTGNSPLERAMNLGGREH